MTPEEIGTMIHLRYLGICSKDLKELPSTVINLTQKKSKQPVRAKSIEHLVLSGKDLPLSVFAISTISHLQTLELHGTLDNNWGINTVSNMHYNLRSLNTVRLFSSNASQALVRALGQLPYLLKLEINKAYNGQELAFGANGFCRLKELELKLDELCTCCIEATCMPQLEKLTSKICSNLRMLPDGLSNLKQLKEMAILHMPKLAQSNNESRDDLHKRFSHVQVIKIRS